MQPLRLQLHFGIHACVTRYRKQVERECSEFHDMNMMQDVELAVRVNQLQLHVLYVELCCCSGIW